MVYRKSIFLAFTLAELSQTRGFKGYTVVIGCADSEYINANIM